MFESCQQKQNEMKQVFADCKSTEEKYQKIIDLGRDNPAIPDPFKTGEFRVTGCQSLMFLHSELRDGLMYFEAEANALISNGLAVLLLRVYNGESPEAVLKCPPSYLEELEINSSLTPGRANGLASLYLRMQQDAIKLYSQSLQNK